MIRPMRSLSPLILTAGLLMGMASLALCDNYLKNADFKEGSQLWRGDGQAAFLKPDGTEGSENDPGAVPVIRLTLSKGQRRSVFQEFQMKDAPNKLHFKVQVYASVDFKRSTHASDYESDDYIPNADFVFRFMPDYFQQTANLKPDEWVTVQGTWTSPTPSDGRAVYFIVPPGEGTIYIKNPSVTP
jgi:hypothetical protein